jgi:hypothetical protein
MFVTNYARLCLAFGSGFGPQHSKAFANSISSIVVSADEILPHISHLSGRIIVNDVVVREPKIDSWQFSLGQVRHTGL